VPDRIEWIGVTSLYDVHTHKTLCIHKVHNKQLFRKNVRSERQDNIITIRFPLGLLFEILATTTKDVVVASLEVAEECHLLAAWNV